MASSNNAGGQGLQDNLTQVLAAQVIQLVMNANSNSNNNQNTSNQMLITHLVSLIQIQQQQANDASHGKHISTATVASHHSFTCEVCGSWLLFAEGRGFFLSPSLRSFD